MKKTLSLLAAVIAVLILAASFTACHDTPGTWGHHSDGPTYSSGGGGSGGSSGGTSDSSTETTNTNNSGTSSGSISSTPAAGTISYVTTTVSKAVGASAFTNALTKTGDGSVSYTSSDTAVATVDASTGEVTIVGAGTAVITATVADSANYTYATSTASYTLTVSYALLTTITLSGSATPSATSSGIVTVSASGVSYYDATYGWLFFGTGSVSVAANAGYTITQCIFRQNAKTPITISTAPFQLEWSGGSMTGYVTSDMDGVTSIEVYGYPAP